MYGVNVSQINQSKSSVLINIPVSDRNDSNFRVLSSELVYLNDLYLSYRGEVGWFYQINSSLEVRNDSLGYEETPSSHWDCGFARALPAVCPGVIMEIGLDV